MREGFSLTSDEIRYSPDSGKLEASGTVRLETPNEVLTGDRLFYDSNTRTGTMTGGELLVTESGFRIRGKEIEKTGEATYTAIDVGVTACEGEVPDWEITAGALDVTMEGFGTLKNGAFRVKGIPVLYTPWALFPVKIKRQSGLLFPDVGQSDRHGVQYLQPFYWAIDDSSDATFYYEFNEMTADRAALEYRRVDTASARVLLQAEGSQDSEGPESLKRTRTPSPINDDRYWFKYKQNAEWGAFDGFVDLDLVSDIHYFDDFDNGALSFDKANAEFMEFMGRSLDTEGEQIRTNRILASRAGKGWRFDAELDWQDNVKARSEDLADPTVKTLPRFRLATSRTRLGSTPFYLSSESEFDYFYRIDGEKGSRIDLAPRLYAPFHLGPVSVDPSIGLRQSWWRTENPDSTVDTGSRSESRNTWSARIDASTEFYRIFDVDTASVDKLKHLIRPQLTFEMTPEEDQDTLPSFDAIDRIDEQNTLTLAFTQTFTTRSTQVGKDGKRHHTYRELARLKLSQPYHFEALTTYDTASDGTVTRTHLEKGAQPVEGELFVTLTDLLGLRVDTKWDPDTSDFTEYNVGLDLGTESGNHARIERRFTDGSADTIASSGKFQFDPRWAVVWDYERNLDTRTDIKLQYGIRYISGCWQLDTIYSDDEDDRKIGFFWTLTGLGQIRSSIGEDVMP